MNNAITCVHPCLPEAGKKFTITKKIIRYKLLDSKFHKKTGVIKHLSLINHKTKKVVKLN